MPCLTAPSSSPSMKTYQFAVARAERQTITVPGGGGYVRVDLIRGRVNVNEYPVTGTMTVPVAAQGQLILIIEGEALYSRGYVTVG